MIHSSNERKNESFTNNLCRKNKIDLSNETMNNLSYDPTHNLSSCLFCQYSLTYISLNYRIKNGATCIFLIKLFSRETLLFTLRITVVVSVCVKILFPSSPIHYKMSELIFNEKTHLLSIKSQFVLDETVYSISFLMNTV